MNILTVGRGSELLEQVLRRRNHNVVSTPGPKKFMVAGTLKKNPSDVCLLCEQPEPEVLSFLKDARIPVWGASTWSAALSVPQYQEAFLGLLPPSVLRKNREQPTFYLDGWWDGVRFQFVFYTLFGATLCCSEVGPDVGGMMSVSAPVPLKSFFWRQLFEPLTNLLNRTDHKGLVRIGILLKEGDYYVTDIQGSPQPLAFLSISELLPDLALVLNQGGTKQLRTQVCGALRVLPSHGTLSSYSGVGWNSTLLDIPADVAKHLTQSAEQIVLTARGLDETEVRRRIWRTLQNVEKILDKQGLIYRTDFGRGWHWLQQELSLLKLL